MIRFLGDLPKKCTIAFSGGVDSVAVADFLLRGRKDVSLAFFHHGTKTSNDAEPFVRSFAEGRRVDLTVGRLRDVRHPGKSQEEHWRDERYTFLSNLVGPVVTCHHLDDAVETWLFTALHGDPRLIPYERGEVIRPFLITPKAELIDWAERNDLKWMEDETNLDVRHARNRIRHLILPETYHINPGLATVIRKKYLAVFPSCRMTGQGNA